MKNASKYFTSVVWNDVNRAIHSTGFYIGFFGILLSILISGGGNFSLRTGKIFDSAHHVSLLDMALHSDLFLSVCPILCTLPYGTVFLDEYETGFYKSFIIRSSRREYYQAKTITPALVGGLLFGITILFAWILLALIYMPFEAKPEIGFLYPFDTILQSIFLYYCASAFWASLAALLTNITLSKYMAYAAPFVFFYILVMLNERYFPNLYLINPKEWIRLEHNWPIGMWGIVIFLISMTACFCFLNSIVIERRLES